MRCNVDEILVEWFYGGQGWRLRSLIVGRTNGVLPFEEES